MKECNIKVVKKGRKRKIYFNGADITDRCFDVQYKMEPGEKTEVKLVYNPTSFAEIEEPEMDGSIKPCEVRKLFKEIKKYFAGESEPTEEIKLNWIKQFDIIEQAICFDHFEECGESAVNDCPVYFCPKEY